MNYFYRYSECNDGKWGVFPDDEAVRVCTFDEETDAKSFVDWLNLAYNKGLEHRGRVKSSRKV